ncbi:MAG: PRC-barrel domain-containing protein [Rhodobacteraceae bacterium]|nr:PRC-barrel domain-containing protein [Paracoccaceae bacterium]
MLNKFLATTALGAMLALPAYAQTADTPEEPTDAPAVEEGMDAPEGDDPMADDPMADDAVEEDLDTDMTEDPDAPATGAEAGMELTADEIIGADVLSFDGGSIANVDDVVLTTEGDVEYILVDVGGFLGLGARTVAIPFADVTVQMDDAGNPELQTQLSEDDLENMPEYEEG